MIKTDARVSGCSSAGGGAKGAGRDGGGGGRKGEVMARVEGAGGGGWKRGRNRTREAKKRWGEKSHTIVGGEAHVY